MSASWPAAWALWMLLMMSRRCAAWLGSCGAVRVASRDSGAEQCSPTRMLSEVKIAWCDSTCGIKHYTAVVRRLGRLAGGAHQHRVAALGGG